jgi:hypothetical protein
MLATARLMMAARTGFTGVIIVRRLRRGVFGPSLILVSHFLIQEARAALGAGKTPRFRRLYIRNHARVRAHFPALEPVNNPLISLHDFSVCGNEMSGLLVYNHTCSGNKSFKPGLSNA